MVVDCGRYLFSFRNAICLLHSKVRISCYYWFYSISEHRFSLANYSQTTDYSQMEIAINNCLSRLYQARQERKTIFSIEHILIWLWALYPLRYLLHSTHRLLKLRWVVHYYFLQGDLVAFISSPESKTRHFAQSTWIRISWFMTLRSTTKLSV